jgi:hypothetical protein
MHLEWLMNPLALYAFAVVGLIATMVLFSSIKMEIAKCRARIVTLETGREADQLSIRVLSTELEKLRASMRALETPKPVPAPRLLAQGGINLTKRAQALRMHRRGETLPSIAAALETPINEIAMILKIQMLTIDLQKAS